MHPQEQNSNYRLAESTEEMKILLEEIITRTKKQGVSDAAVNLNHENGLSIDVRMGEVETATFSEDKKISLTVYFGHRKGSASGTDTSSKGLDELVAAACDIAKYSAEDPCFGLADKALLNNQFEDIKLFETWDIKPEQAIEAALACEKTALNYDKRIVNSEGVSISTYTSYNGYINTRGAEGFVHSSNHGMSCSLIAQSGEQMQRDYDYSTARHPKYLKDFDVVANTAAKRAIERLGARKIKTQKAPVAFSNRVASSIFLHFIAAIRGSNLYQGQSFLLDSIGKKIFPSFVQIHEQPHLDYGLRSEPFDAEGVPTRNNKFVVDGAIEQYVLGSYAARRLGLETTANSDGVHNLIIDANTQDLDAILKQMNQGLLVTELMGQGVNLLNGDYSRGASGFWVEQGEIQYPVEEITIAGNLLDIFQNISLIGKDFEPASATHCGAVLVNQMMIAGA